MERTCTAAIDECYAMECESCGKVVYKLVYIEDNPRLGEVCMAICRKCARELADDIINLLEAQE